MNVGLFIPCYIDLFYPKVGIATLELLERLGCRVTYPMAQTCCGQPMANTGYENDATKTYEHFVDTFRAFDYIVAPSGSCTHHVRHHYDRIPQTQDVQNVRNVTFDLVDFLTDILEVGALDATFEGRVGLHLSCHGLRGLRQGSGSERNIPRYSKIRDLLEMVEGVSLIEPDRPDECCGFGGTFAVNEAAVSTKMGMDRIQDHISHGAQFVTAGDMSCLMHLEGLISRNKLPLKVVHLAEILNSKRN